MTNELLINAGKTLYRLDAENACLLVCADSAVPRIVWFGEPMPAIDDEQSLMAITDSAVPQAKIDQTTPLTIFPDNGSGFLGPVALEGHRNGMNFTCTFALEKVDVQESALSFFLLDVAAALRVVIKFGLDAQSSVMTINTSLENISTEAFTVNKLVSATLPISDNYTECMTLHGRWGLEFQQHRNAIGATQLRIENNTGRTSHENFPGCVVGQQHFNAEVGQLMGVHLGYSGNYALIVDRLSSGDAYVQAGLTILPGEITLEANKVFAAPPVYACAENGLNQMSQRFHRFARNHILPKWTRQPRPVHANSWEALYFDHNEQTLLSLVDAAADIGAERFVLDDGWFHGRRDDTSSLGDWWVDKTIYPQGLHKLVAHVRKHGMQFGLWFEPEMVNPNSDLYRNHPEWVLQIEGHTTPLARHQLVLNLGLADVREYLYDCIASLVEEYKIDYIKWDMNRDLVLPGSNGKAGVVTQTDGVYALIYRLKSAYPTLENESCSSGGARADYGMLARTGRVWTSDSIDPIDRLTIQRGFGLFFPPEIMGSHVGHDVAHLTGRATSLNTRAIVAMQGQYGYELDARKVSDNERQQLIDFVNQYKQHRAWFAESTSWVVATRDEALFVQGQVSQDQSKAVWTVVTAKSLDTTLPERIKLLGLDRHRRYQLNTTGWQALKPYGKLMPSWVVDGVVVSGAELMSIGVSLPVMPAQCGLLLECVEVGAS